MHSITFHSRTFIVRDGESIHAAMKRNGFRLHRKGWLRASRLRLCVPVQQTKLSMIERWMLGHPPWNQSMGLRLNYQNLRQ